MTDTTFDSYALVKRLTGSGVSEEAAEALSEHFLRMQDQRFEREIEAQLREVERSLEAVRMQLVQEDRRMEAYQSEVRGDIERLELRLKHDLTVRLGGMIVAGVAALAVLKIIG